MTRADGHFLANPDVGQAARGNLATGIFPADILEDRQKRLSWRQGEEVVRRAPWGWIERSPLIWSIPTLFALYFVSLRGSKMRNTTALASEKL